MGDLVQVLSRFQLPKLAMQSDKSFAFEADSRYYLSGLSRLVSICLFKT